MVKLKSSLRHIIVTVVMRLNGLEEYMTDLIAWQQKVDDLLHNGAI